MPSPVFEQAYLLQSLGWAIGNSFWQTGSLWLVYQAITRTDKKLPALVKHHLAIALLITSFTWFLSTVLQNYRLLAGGTSASEMLINSWAFRLQAFNKALPFLAIIYLLLLFFYTARFCKSLLANRFLQIKGLTKAPIDLRLFATKTALHLGIKKKIGVWLSDHVDVPSVTGFIKPVILLPAAIVNHLSIRQTEAILLHELAHIKRNDYLINFLQSIVELILFFNPFAIMLSKAARKERENCCDDWVINFRYDHYEYASALVVLEEQRHRLHYGFALTATNGKKNLLDRVKRLFNADPQTYFSSFQKLKMAGLCILLLGTMFIALPYMINKAVKENAIARKINFAVKMDKPNEVKPVVPASENAIKSIFASLPVKSKKEKIGPVRNNKTRKQAVKVPSGEEYVNAFVNEELLNPVLSQVQSIVTQAVDKEVKSPKYLVKIEEQRSGKKDINTYYFELNNTNGNAAVKPLMMLNKFKVNAPAVNKVLKNLHDSLNHLTKIVIRKRITS